VITPESRNALLHDHCHLAYTRREEVVRNILRVSQTYFAFALDAEQNDIKCSSRHRHLIGAHVGVSAVQGAGVLLVPRVVKIVDRDLLRVRPGLARLHALWHEWIGWRGDYHHALVRIH